MNEERVGAPCRVAASTSHGGARSGRESKQRQRSPSAGGAEAAARAVTSEGTRTAHSRHSRRCDAGLALRGLGSGNNEAAALSPHSRLVTRHRLEPRHTLDPVQLAEGESTVRPHLCLVGSRGDSSGSWSAGGLVTPEEEAPKHSPGALRTPCRPTTSLLA